jgi:hypothetical protein
MITLLRRLVAGRDEPAGDDTLRPVGDDHPKDAFFARPLSVTALQARIEDLPADADDPDADARVRAVFVATVKDADGKRCPDMAVYARINGPHRTATGMGHTSLLGQVTFRMSGPPGAYTCEIEDVAGGALGLDRDASVLRASTSGEPA